MITSLFRRDQDVDRVAAFELTTALDAGLQHQPRRFVPTRSELPLEPERRWRVMNGKVAGASNWMNRTHREHF